MRGASSVTAGTCSALNPHEHRCRGHRRGLGLPLQRCSR
jgi:hypothetical protein